MKDNRWRSLTVGGEAPEEHPLSDALPDTPLPSMALFLSFSSASSPPSSVFVGNLKTPSPPPPLISLVPLFLQMQLQLDFKGHFCSRESWMFSRLRLWNSCLPLFRTVFCPFRGPCHNCRWPPPPPPFPSPTLSQGPVGKLSLTKK